MVRRSDSDPKVPDSPWCSGICSRSVHAAGIRLFEPSGRTRHSSRLLCRCIALNDDEILALEGMVGSHDAHSFRKIPDVGSVSPTPSTKIPHSALLDRVRRRIEDRRILALVKAFLKAGVLGEDQVERDTVTGTPQGSLCFS